MLHGTKLIEWIPSSHHSEGIPPDQAFHGYNLLLLKFCDLHFGYHIGRFHLTSWPRLVKPLIPGTEDVEIVYLVLYHKPCTTLMAPAITSPAHFPFSKKNIAPL
jgi:hypothetical protein